MQTQEDRYREDSETAESVLVQQSISGDQEAFEVLVSRYKQSLFGLIHHYVGEYHEAEDILEHVWLQLYLSLATLRPSVQIKPWLFTVARNRSLDFLRHKHLHAGRLLLFSEVEESKEEDEKTFLDTIPDTSPTPEEQAELHDLQCEIQHTIRALPQVYRPVVWLFYRSQLNYAEIGRILDIPGSTVKTQFNRAKPFLRTVFAAPLSFVVVSLTSSSVLVCDLKHLVSRRDEGVRQDEVLLCDLKKGGSSMSQRAMNGYEQQEFFEIVDRFITLHCRVGIGLSISDKTLFPAFRAFWIATVRDAQHPALLGQFRVELAERGFRSNGPKRPRWYGLTLHQLSVL